MTTTPLRRSLPLLTGVLAAAGLLMACGGGGADGEGAEVASLGTSDAATDDTAETSTSLDPDEAMLAYTECMRDHGIDLPDPRPAGEGGGMIALEVDPSSDEFEEAQTACEPIMEDAFGDMELDPEAEAEMREQLLAYAECMREHGVDMPDPQFGEGGRVQMDAGQAVDPGALDEDEFAAANEECGGEGGLIITSDTIASSGS